MAQATIFKSYGYDGDLETWVLFIQGDETDQPIVLGCSGGDQTVNGQFFFRSSVNRNLYCNEPEHIGVNGMGGDDTISTAAVSKAGGYDPARSIDYPRAASHAIHVIGGSGSDTLTGGPFGEYFNDTNNAFEPGPDTVRAGAGNDEVWGTRHDDKLFGDGGNDVIYPQGGRDVAHGGAGHDAFDDLPFGKDRDTFFGEGGPDQLFGGGGPDLLDGGPGNDYMDGGAGNDRILGRAGNDGLFGMGGADVLFGHGGNDFLRGGAGKDKLVPGPGRDDARQ